jgi:hypothetical protein
LHERSPRRGERERKREELYYAVLTIACRRLLLEGGLDDLGLYKVRKSKLKLILEIKK